MLSQNLAIRIFENVSEYNKDLNFETKTQENEFQQSIHWSYESETSQKLSVGAPGLPRVPQRTQGPRGTLEIASNQ